MERFGASYSVSDLLIWSAEEFSTQRISEQFRTSLPVLCRISTGYSGRDETTHSFGQDEMFWVFEIYSQPRVTVIDDLNRQLSIPFDYRYRFQIVENSDRILSQPPKKMGDLVPLLEPGCTKLMVENNKRVSFGFGADQKELAALGLIRFKERRDVDFLIGYPLIEEFLHPVPVLLPTYVPTELRVALGFQYGSGNEFTKFTTELKKAVSQFSKLPAELCNDIMIFRGESDSDTESVTYLHPSVFLQQQLTSISEQDNCSDSSADEVGPPRQPGAKTPVAMRRNAERKKKNKKKEKPYPLPPMPRPLPHIETVPEKEVVITYFKHYGQVTCPQKPPVAGPGAPPIPPRQGSESPGNIRRRKRESDVREAEEEVPGHDAVPAVPPPAPPLPPDRRKAWGDADDFTGSGKDEHRKRNYWQNVADIPLFVSTFTIEEVSYCLDALNMDQHAQKFADNHVDGALLVSLNETILQATFDLSEFDAIKLMKFARDGWRPRMSKDHGLR